MTFEALFWYGVLFLGALWMWWDNTYNDDDDGHHY
jgi:hypothetical protein